MTEAAAVFDGCGRELHRFSASTLATLSEAEQGGYFANLAGMKDYALALPAARPDDPALAARSAEWVVNLKNYPATVLGAQARLARTGRHHPHRRPHLFLSAVARLTRHPDEQRVASSNGLGG